MIKPEDRNKIEKTVDEILALHSEVDCMIDLYYGYESAVFALSKMEKWISPNEKVSHYTTQGQVHKRVVIHGVPGIGSLCQRLIENSNNPETKVLAVEVFCSQLDTAFRELLDDSIRES